MQEDESTFNPEQDTHDYEEIARNLPVFCVSSRAYQKIRGRLEKDDFQVSTLCFPLWHALELENPLNGHY
jgi:hypothetical protein